MWYAVVWSENGGPIRAGGLELMGDGVLLAGRSQEEGKSSRTLLYEDFAGVWVERRPDGRLDGRPALVLERRDGLCIRIASVGGPSALPELAEHIARARAERLQDEPVAAPSARR
jgi:hypothetical protein